MIFASTTKLFWKIIKNIKQHFKKFKRSSVSPTNQDLSNDTTFSQIKSRFPVPLNKKAVAGGQWADEGAEGAAAPEAGGADAEGAPPAHHPGHSLSNFNLDSSTKSAEITHINKKQKIPGSRA